MQGAIYTWTEEQVAEKLSDVADEYKYIEAIGNVQGCVYHSLEAAKKDLANLFKFLRISFAAIEKLNPEWFCALQVLYRISKGEAVQLSKEVRKKEIAILEKYGNYAKDCLTDGKPILSDILMSKNIECTSDELSTIYSGLKDMSCEASLTQFEKELDVQIGRISFARNKVTLKETWTSITGCKTVKEWCALYEAPILWIVPSDLQKAVSTLIEVQNGGYTADASVVSAISIFQNISDSFLTDKNEVEKAFLNIVGIEYLDIWNTDRSSIINKAKLKFGNDMSNWSITDLSSLQKMLKQTLQEKAKKEKLVGTKNAVSKMKDSVLRERVNAFLDSHPEFCDDFTE